MAVDRQNRLQAGIAVEIIRNGLAAIAEEMAISHMRTAYSSVARDLLDFSTAVCDGRGRVLAQGLSLPLQLGAIPRHMSMLGEQIRGPERGDVYLMNHPWKGGVHLPDFFFVKPVFFEDGAMPAGYTVLVSHMVDVGGRFPGGLSLSSASLWEEGLVIPPVALVKGGVQNQALLDLIASNTRVPAAVLGDIRAALAGLETGARQFLDLARRMGEANFLRHAEDLLGATERATRNAFARDIPDGGATASDFLDDEDLGEERHKIVCRVEKRKDRLSFDFSGSASQLPFGMNCNLSDVMSAAAFAARTALREDLPVNDGFYRCLETVAPEGTVMNARYPAPVCGRGASVRRMTDVALAAMAHLVPGRMPATPGNTGILYFSGHFSGKAWIFLDSVHGGWGGTPAGDGVPGLSHPVLNTANTPIEASEKTYPIRITEYGMATDTAAVGKHLGAPCTVRAYEILADGTTLNVQLSRSVHVAKGLAGGANGTPSAGYVIRRGGKREPISATCTLALNAGDRVRVRTAGGGGHGDPRERSTQALEADVCNGLLTAGFVAVAFARSRADPT